MHRILGLGDPTSHTARCNACVDLMYCMYVFACPKEKRWRNTTFFFKITIVFWCRYFTIPKRS